MSIYNIKREIDLKRRTLNDQLEKNPISMHYINSEHVVVDWGQIVKEINYRNYDINNFSISPLILCMSNKSGYFYHESRNCSLWNGFLTRIYSEIEIFVKINDSQRQSVYYGFIDNIKNTYSGKSYITIQPQQYILTKFNIKDLKLKNPIFCEEILRKILNNPLIKRFIPEKYIFLGLQGISIKEPQNLQGTYWDVIRYICLITNSYFYFYKKRMRIISKNEDAGSTDIVLTSYHTGKSEENIIYSIGNFDDEGHKKIRLGFKDKNNEYISLSTNTNILNKYLGLTNSVADIEIVDLTNVENNDKQLILDSLLSFWERPRRSLELVTRFNNKFDLLKKLKIDIRQNIFETKSTRWGQFYWGDGSKWGDSGTDFVVYKEKDWIIKYLKNDLNEFKSYINIEEI